MPCSHLSGEGSFNATGKPEDGSWVWDNEYCSTEKTGCRLLYRGDPFERPSGSPDQPEIIKLLDDTSSDEDWVPQSNEEEDKESTDGWDSDMDGVDDTSTHGSDGDAMDVDEDQNIAVIDHYADFVRTLNINTTVEAESTLTKEDMLPIPDPPWDTDNAGEGEADHSLVDGKPLDHYEHIAGPGCEMRGAYNGNNISAQQMHGCKTMQALARKERGWMIASDDLSFEKESHYYLTGLANDLPSRDSGSATFVPHRHDAEDIMADVIVMHVSCPSAESSLIF